MRPWARLHRRPPRPHAVFLGDPGGSSGRERSQGGVRPRQPSQLEAARDEHQSHRDSGVSDTATTRAAASMSGSRTTAASASEAAAGPRDPDATTRPTRRTRAPPGPRPPPVPRRSSRSGRATRSSPPRASAGPDGGRPRPRRPAAGGRAGRRLRWDGAYGVQASQNASPTRGTRCRRPAGSARSVGMRMLATARPSTPAMPTTAMPFPSRAPCGRWATRPGMPARSG